MSYCEYIAKGGEDEAYRLHKLYHDTQYGFPLENDNELFGRLVLEINQAGLSWTTILKKQEHFKRAYSNWNIAKVAAYGEADRNRLLEDVGIIRNRLKVDAAIHNAQQILNLQKEYGSFHKWIAHHHPMEKAAWVKLFKKTFKFTGGEIVGEFLMSTGWLPGAHAANCSISKLLKQKAVGQF